MDIPRDSPIRFEEFESLIKTKAEEITQKGMFVTSIVLNPQTIHEIVMDKYDKNPHMMPTMINNLGIYPMIGNPDIEQYDFRFEISCMRSDV